MIRSVISGGLAAKWNQDWKTAAGKSVRILFQSSRQEMVVVKGMDRRVFKSYLVDRNVKIWWLIVRIEGEAKVKGGTLHLGGWIDGDAWGKTGSGEEIRMVFHVRCLWGTQVNSAGCWTYGSGTQKSKHGWYVRPQEWLGVPAQLVNSRWKTLSHNI